MRPWSVQAPLVLADDTAGDITIGVAVECCGPVRRIGSRRPVTTCPTGVAPKPEAPSSVRPDFSPATSWVPVEEANTSATQVTQAGLRYVVCFSPARYLRDKLLTACSSPGPTTPSLLLLQGCEGGVFANEG